MHVERRTMLAVAAVVAMAAAGCSSDNGSDPEATTAAGSPTTDGSAGPDESRDSAPSSSEPAPPAETSPGPDLPTNPRNQERVLDALDGSASAGCARVGDAGDLRSGSVAMGNFSRARTEFADQVGSAEQPVVHLYVIPEHTRGTSGLDLRLAPADGGGSTTVRVRRLESADVWKYYPVAVNVPGPGTYRLTAVSGPDRGCFLVEFGAGSTEG